jgi:hypothetical protein
MSQATKDLVGGDLKLGQLKKVSILSFGFAIGLALQKQKANAKHTHFQSKLSIRKGKVVFKQPNH